MAFDLYLVSSFKLNYAFNERITISLVRKANGVRVSHSEARYLLEKEIIARAFSRRFTIARWKKPIFPVTCENKKNGVPFSENRTDGCATEEEDKHAPILGHFG